MDMDKLMWLGIAAAVIGLVIQLIKTDRFDALLLRFGLPSIPKRFMPWIALGLGVLAAVLQLVLSPGTFDLKTVLEELLSGILSGAAPVMVHELGTARAPQ